MADDHILREITDLRNLVRALRGRVSSVWADLRHRLDELEESTAEVQRNLEEQEERLHDMENTLGRALSRYND